MNTYRELHCVHGFTDIHDGSFKTFEERQAWFDDHYRGVPAYEVSQDHTDRVYVVNNERNPRTVYPGIRADALLYRKRGAQQVVLAIKTADCVPILLYDPQARIIGALHSGWKGTLHNIVGTTIRKMKKFGARPERIQAAIGPAINACCYTVTYERRQLFMQAGYPVRDKSLCLAEIACAQMKTEGIRSIATRVSCTACQKDRYHSYRAQGATHGTMIAFICL